MMVWDGHTVTVWHQQHYSKDIFNVFYFMWKCKSFTTLRRRCPNIYRTDV